MFSCAGKGYGDEGAATLLYLGFKVTTLKLGFCPMTLFTVKLCTKHFLVSLLPEKVPNL